MRIEIKSPRATLFYIPKIRSLPKTVPPVSAAMFLVAILLAVVCIVGAFVAFYLFGRAVLAITNDWSQVWPVMLAAAILFGGWLIVGTLFYVGAKNLAEDFRDFWHSGKH